MSTLTEYKLKALMVVLWSSNKGTSEELKALSELFKVMT